MNKGSIVITGAGGYIGAHCVDGLLNESSASLILLLNASNEESLETKSAPLKARWKDSLYRLKFIAADLRQPSFDFLNSIDKSEVQGIIHTAALINFNVSESDANLVNRDASIKIFEWGKTCPHLESFLYVSTLYVSGVMEGAVEEKFFPEVPAFANHYERSKWEAENYLRLHGGALPWKIARIGTVISEDNSGKVTQYNAIHNTLKLFYYGLISTLPGEAQTPVYFVTGEETVKALLQFWLKGQQHEILHIVHPKEKTLTLGETIELAYQAFQEDPGFRQRRMLKPVFVNLASFEKLVQGVTSFGSKILGQAVGSIAPFGRQLYIHKDIQAQKILELDNQFHHINPQELMTQTCRYLVKSRFGKENS